MWQRSRIAAGLLLILLALVPGLYGAACVRATGTRLDAVNPALPAPGWSVECVECPKDWFEIGDRSLALDADGHAHALYAGDDLYHALARWRGVAA